MLGMWVKVCSLYFEFEEMALIAAVGIQHRELNFSFIVSFIILYGGMCKKL
jgi:hypothetical protein